MKTKKKQEKQVQETGKIFYSKDDVAEILKAKGFNSTNESGVIITKFLSGKDGEYYKQKELEIKEIFDSIGYKASNGIHIIKEAKYDTT